MRQPDPAFFGPEEVRICEVPLWKSRTGDSWQDGKRNDGGKYENIAELHICPCPWHNKNLHHQCRTVYKQSVPYPEGAYIRSILLGNGQFPICVDRIDGNRFSAFIWNFLPACKKILLSHPQNEWSTICFRFLQISSYTNLVRSNHDPDRMLR